MIKVNLIRKQLESAKIKQERFKINLIRKQPDIAQIKVETANLIIFKLNTERYSLNQAIDSWIKLK